MRFASWGIVALLCIRLDQHAKMLDIGRRRRRLAQDRGPIDPIWWGNEYTGIDMGLVVGLGVSYNAIF